MKLIPTHEGIWQLIEDGQGRPVEVHDPTGDGLQFDAGAVCNETNLAAYEWGGEYILEPQVGVAHVDAKSFLAETPSGSCRRVTERGGDGAALTFEQDCRANGDDALPNWAIELEKFISKLISGGFGGTKVTIGGHEVYVADPRYVTGRTGGFFVSTSSEPRNE